MAKSLCENLGMVQGDDLFVWHSPAPDVVTVKLAASQGVLPRGAVVTGTAGGELSQASAALVATNATYVLADEVDTGTDAAVTAIAYRTGHFNKQAMACKSYTLVAADVEILRNAGIMLSDAIYDNEVE